jgi:hypothetical protein
VAIVETPAGVKHLHYLVTLISDVLYKNSALDHQTLATYIHRMIEADHPEEPTPPGQLPPEVTFGSNLIGFSKMQAERVQIATAQATLLKLGFEVGRIDGQLGPKTINAIKAFQIKQQMKADGQITEKLLEQLKVAVERLPRADPSQPVRVPE